MSRPVVQAIWAVVQASIKIDVDRLNDSQPLTGTGSGFSTTVAGQSPVAAAPVKGGIVKSCLSVCRMRWRLRSFSMSATRGPMMASATFKKSRLSFPHHYFEHSRGLHEEHSYEDSVKIFCVIVSSIFFTCWLSNDLSTSFWTISTIGTINIVLCKTDFKICLTIGFDCMILANWD